MVLREENLLGWSFLRSPLLDSALQSSDLAVLVTARMLALKVVKNRLRLQTRGFA